MNKMREVCELIGVPFESHFTVRFKKPYGIVFELYADYDGLYIVLPTGDLYTAGSVIWAKLAKGEYQIESVAETGADHEQEQE